MSQSQDAWVEVGDHLKTLGSKLKSRYRAQESGERPEPASREEVRDALNTLSETVVAAFGTFGEALTDPEVKAEARETAGLFLEALGVSFSELGADVSKGTESGDSETPEPSGSVAPTELEQPDSPGFET